MTVHVKTSLIAVLSSNPEMFGWIRRGYCALGLGTRTERDFLFSFAKRKKDVFFLEIGANDGIGGDPLHYFIKRYKWNGLALEPLPDIFEKLRHTYENDEGVTPHCAALADRDGEMTFYRIEQGSDVPEWCNGLGSFSRDTILSHKHKFPEIGRYVVEQKVQVVSFNTLVEQFGIDKIDVILIDTEGYDYEILKQIDFRRFRPSLVIYEQLHLSESAKLSSKALLVNLGYEVHNSYNMNFVAVRKR